MLEVLFGLVFVLLLLNVWATYWVIQDKLSSPGQRTAQIIIVWCLPIIGALLTLFIKRQKPDRASGRYREEPDPGDDFGYSGRSHRQNRDRQESETSASEADGGD